MSSLQIIFTSATLIGAAGLWLLLPRGNAPGRALGAVLALVSLGLLLVGSGVPRLGDWLADSVFLVLAGVTIFSAGATISFRNPVYCAIWFAMVLLGSSGLFLFQGAQFLGVATVVVYAGAILVTFLFVLMLANPRGQAYYDRLSWEAMLSAAAGAVMIGILTLALASIFQAPGEHRPVVTVDAEARAGDILAPQHMAHLGEHLFSEHLMAVEVAGTLLLVALVGAVAIVAQSRQSEESTEQQHDG